MSQQVPPAESETAPLSNEEIFDVLQNERRRHVLQYLRRNGGPVSLGDLADHVAAEEYDCTPEDVTSAQRKRVYTTLQQSHLPQMDEVGIVDYDSDEGVIATTEQTEELTVYLEIVPEGEFPWREFYLSFGAISLAIVTVLWAGVYPFTVIPPLVWATLFATVLTLSSLYHTLVAREMTLTEFADDDDATR